MNKILDLYKRINFYGSWWEDYYAYFLIPTIILSTVESTGLKILLS